MSGLPAKSTGLVYMHFGEALLHALNMTLVMTWEIFWALVLGFALSGAIQAVVSKGEMSRLLPDSSPRSILKASLLGAASSSCSYAATAIAREIDSRMILLLSGSQTGNADAKTMVPRAR